MDGWMNEWVDEPDTVLSISVQHFGWRIIDVVGAWSEQLVGGTRMDDPNA